MIPIIYSGTSIPPPISGSVLEKYHAQCPNKLYAIYGSYYDNNYEKQFISMGMRHDGSSLTGFGILIAKRGTPSAPLLVGITLGSPPDDPFSSSSYVEQATIQPNLLQQDDTFYWAVFYLTTPIDISHTPFVVAITDANYDTQTDFWVWGACNGIVPGLDSAEKYVPQTMGLGLGSLACQGPGGGWTCLSDGVDIMEQPMIVNDDDTFPYEPLTNITVNNPYKIIVKLQNQNFWYYPENYTLEFYWDDDATYFGCHEDCITMVGPDVKNPRYIEFIISSLPSLVNGSHQLKVRMKQKPSVEYIINVIVEGGPFEWTATPDTVSFFSYTAGGGDGCKNPDGVNGDWYCDGTTKRTCNGSQWIDTVNSPDCQAPPGCVNPTGKEGDTNCFGKDLYKCQSRKWTRQQTDAPECMGCDCENLSPEDCELANAEGSQCCWYYSKYFWEEPTCHDTPQDYLRDYLPIIAIAGGAALLLIALSMGRKPPTMYYPPPPPDS